MELKIALVVVAGGVLVLAVLVDMARRLIRAGPAGVFARGLLLLGASAWLALGVASAVAAVATAPWLLLIIAVALVYFCRPQWKNGGWHHGTARFADFFDLLWFGMLFRADGLPLGRISPPSLRHSFRALRLIPLRLSEAVSRIFLASLLNGWLWVSATRFTHAVVFAGAGKGKTTSIVIPYLLSCNDSTIVVDIKGEIYQETHSAKRAMGHKVVLLDPYGCVPDATSDRWNPLEQIDPASPHAIEDSRGVAAAIVQRLGTEPEPHWNDMSEAVIAGVTASVLALSAPMFQNLQSVAEVTADETKLATAIVEMKKSKAWGGLLARMGHQLGYLAGEEFSSVMTGVGKQLRFLASPAFVANTECSTFDPRELATGRMTIYLVVPPDRLSAQAGLLRLWISSLLRVLVRSGLKKDKKIRFVLDEAAALGRMEAIEDAVAQLRGYGLSMLFIYQSMGQLKKVFTLGQDQTFLSNMDIQVHFGVTEYAEAEHISQKMGRATVVAESVNGGRSSGKNYDPQGMESHNTGVNSGYGLQEAARELLQPSEVLNLDERTAIVFAPNIPPLLTQLTRSYEPAFKSRPKPSCWSGVWLVARCLVLAALSCAGVAAVAGIAVSELSKAQVTKPKTSPSAPPVPKAQPKQFEKPPLEKRPPF